MLSLTLLSLPLTTHHPTPHPLPYQTQVRHVPAPLNLPHLPSLPSQPRTVSRSD